MALILGLDVSTSCTGVCVVNSDIEPDDKGSHIVLLDRIEFKKCKTLWEKAAVVANYMDDMLRGTLQGDEKIRNLVGLLPDRVVLEEPLMRFTPGMSSAATISTLLRFNGIVSYIATTRFKLEPEYIAAGHARKLCGIKLVKTALGGPQKEQVFSHMEKHDLKHVVWPTKKKSDKHVDWSRDTTDAYVIARAASINGPIVVVKKPKKVKKVKVTVP